MYSFRIEITGFLDGDIITQARNQSAVYSEHRMWMQNSICNLLKAIVYEEYVVY